MQSGEKRPIPTKINMPKATVDALARIKAFTESLPPRKPEAETNMEANKIYDIV